MRFSIVTLLLLSLSLVSGGYTTNKPQPAVTQPPATAAPTVYVYPTEAPTEPPTLPAVTQPPTVYVYPTEEPTEKPDDDVVVVVTPPRPNPTQPPVVVVQPPRPNPTQPPVVVVQPPRPNPTQPPTTVIIYPVYPSKCFSGETPVCIQGGPIPTNCRQAWIQWDQCECKFWCNNTAAPVATNPTQTVIVTNPTSQPTNTPVDTITITTNVTKPSNNTRCIAGICITLDNAAPSTVVSFPVVMAILLGLAALL